MSQMPLANVSWERMIRAVEKVRERLQRAAAALAGAGVPYAVAGGNAVAAWVSRVDEAAVRNTRDVDILLRRSDLEAAAAALSQAGFIRRHVSGIEMFLDGPRPKPAMRSILSWREKKFVPNTLHPRPMFPRPRMRRSFAS